MNFLLSHIYREKNYYADKLANLGLSILILYGGHPHPVYSEEDLDKNMLGLPYYRFS
jgi:hypothetical protein